MSHCALAEGGGLPRTRKPSTRVTIEVVLAPWKPELRMIDVMSVHEVNMT